MRSDDLIEQKRLALVEKIRADVRDFQRDTHAAVKAIPCVPDETAQFDDTETGPPMPMIDVVIEVDAGDEARAVEGER